MPRKIVAANWKMNNDEYSSKKLTFDFLKYISESNNTKVLKILSVPFPFLNTVTKMCEGVDSVFVSAQNSRKHYYCFRAFESVKQGPTEPTIFRISISDE